VKLFEPVLPATDAPRGVVTTTGTVAPLATAGETAVTEVADTFVKLVAATPPKVTAVAPDRLRPVMFTDVPPVMGPAFGEIELTTDCGEACPAMEMFAVAFEPPEVPYPIVHESPALIWACVGGHGYFAASVAAFPPLESVPVAGGPSTPVLIVNGVGGRLPLPSVL
jgi:hypothetical protein